MVISKERKFMVPWCVDHMLPTISSLFKFLILCSSLLYICSSASDTIMFNNSISDERGDTLVSASETFELGFFTPNESLSKARYVGIWYYNFTQQTVVWVANRDSPLSDPSGSFGVTEDGNLTVLDGKGNAIWSRGPESNRSSDTTAKLLDSGNLVLISDDGTSVWESFMNPTDAFLPGMKMSESLKLTSWKSSNNPAQGSFTFIKVDQGTADQFKVRKDKVNQYWTSETDPMPYPLVSLLSNSTGVSVSSASSASSSASSSKSPISCGKGKSYAACLPGPTNNRNINPTYDRVVMSSTGEIRYLRWDANKNWFLLWLAPRDQCGALNFCGKFGSCNINNRLVCKCLPGFHPSSSDYWESGDFSGGCFRKSQICSKKGDKETFLSLKNMKVRDANTQIEAGTETECRNKCLDNCNCQAYSYDNSSTTVPAVCLIWTEDLTNLQEEYSHSGSRNVSVRVYLSDIDTIMSDNSISDEKGETLISARKTFELGFFAPNESSNNSRYVGIWYYNSTPQTVVWVANRDSPLFDRSGSFGVTEDGSLKLLDRKGNATIVYTKLESNTSSNTIWTLQDSGNLVLISDDGTSVWESFMNPTDTFLPGMNMSESLNLTSWKSSNDPAPGNFTFKRDGGGEYQIISGKWNLYWKNGSETGDFIPLDVAKLLSNSPMITSGTLRTQLTPQPITGGTGIIVGTTNPGTGEDPRTRFPEGCNSRVCSLLSNGGGTSPAPSSTSNTPQNYSDTTALKSRLVMSYSGELQYIRWDIDKKNWSLAWWAPKNRCGSLNACGNFGSCNSNNTIVCKCLPGFKPIFTDDFSGGCEPKSAICSENGVIETFLNLTMMKVREPDTHLTAASEKECKDRCLGFKSCDCKAYSYAPQNTTASCSIWQGDLSNLQEESVDGGRNFSVRVNLSDIDPIMRSCKNCGTYIIPYPLSTGPNCGDPMYSSFQCNMSTGQVSFKAPNGTYRVINIDPDRRNFVIQAKDAVTYEAGNLAAKFLQLNQSFPFHVSTCSVDREEVELSWDPPQEPTCNSPADCKDWPNSSCNVTREGKKRCLCSANFRWIPSNLNCEPRKKSRSPLIIVVTFTTVIVFAALLACTAVYCLKLRRKREAERKRNQAIHLYDTERRAKYLIETEQFREEDRKGIDVPFFDLETILVATNNFSDANKLGKGGFGPVYKGKFPEGREIAVKRLSSVTGQGLKEFMNEVVLIAKLQHRNLIKLVGYCIRGEEKILLYEYMPNKSLDTFIFDRTRSVLLDWKLRFNIILGIARGLLYLHQDSRLTIIHRDLKSSNILLNEEMIPKISDFGLAKMFEGKQTEANTNKPSGTRGYMSPEYAYNGFISVKSDVFSFGVVILEIVSGKKATTEFYQSEQTLNLPSYAWRLWNEGKALDLMDQILCKTCNVKEFLKCVNVGLLCVQDDYNDRPTMSNVVVMLDGEVTTLSTPKQPIFVAQRGTPNKSETFQPNEVTITKEEGR